MYSASGVAVDKVSEMTGLGFDFSDISKIVQSAVPVGLQIFNNVLQKKQVQQMSQANYANGYVNQSPGIYGNQYGMLPLNQALQPRPTLGGGAYAQPSGWMDTSTMLMIGAAAVVGLLAFKMLK